MIQPCNSAKKSTRHRFADLLRCAGEPEPEASDTCLWLTGMKPEVFISYCGPSALMFVALLLTMVVKCCS